VRSYSAYHYENTGVESSFGPAEVLIVGSYELRVDWLDLADVNLDGATDFFVVRVLDDASTAAEITMYQCWTGDGAGGVGGTCGSLAAQVEAYPMGGKIVASDVDGDGLADALFSHKANGVHRLERALQQ